MANHIEFRIVRTIGVNGQVTGIRFQFRSKDVTASILGLTPLSANWSSWTDIDVVVMDE